MHAQMRIMKTIRLKACLIALISSACLGAFAQADVDSPYSLFGVGQVRGNAMNVRLKAMGGVANAMSSPGMINTGNPASLAKMDSLAFLFDAGAYFKTSNFSTSNKTELGANASFDYVAMAFGFAPWWKTAFGVQPYSTSGYKMVVDGYKEDVGTYSTVFKGSGGLNQVFWSNAFKLGKHFALGANVYYVFGNTQSITTLYLPDSTYSIGTRRSLDMMVSSFMFDYGLMFNANVATDMTLSVGLTYDQSVKLGGTQTLFIRSIEEDMDTEIEYLIDTVYAPDPYRAYLTMPQGFGVGVALEKNKRWCLAADFNWTQWSRFAREGVTEDLHDSWNVALGFEYMPTYSSVSNYFRRASYRIGGFYEKGFLSLPGNDGGEHNINKIGITAGIALPLPKSLSRVNLALELGQYGTREAGLIQERYLKFEVGISVFERWFIKRKYK